MWRPTRSVSTHNSTTHSLLRVAGTWLSHVYTATKEEARDHKPASRPLKASIKTQLVGIYGSQRCGWNASPTGKSVCNAVKEHREEVSQLLPVCTEPMFASHSRPDPSIRTDARDNNVIYELISVENTPRSTSAG